MKLRVKTYSTTDPGVTRRETDHRAVARRAAADGIVLLKNENGLLPLKKGAKVALYGSGANRTVKGGTGSGDVNERERVTVYQGLLNAGITVTTEKWIADYDAAYQKAREDWREFLLAEGGKDMMNFFHVYSSHPFIMPDGRPIEEADVAASATDIAVYVLGRIAGEGADRMAQKGDYYLTDAQRADMEFLCARYAHVVLVINAGAQVDLSFTESLPAIQAILYMVQAGMEGGNALADVLTGAVTPSGKLTDSWARAYQDYPAAATFSHNKGSVEKEFYEEGIYVGYRWFDSFGTAPMFPFGFGLSYTHFSIVPGTITTDEAAQTVTVSAAVTNIGDTYAGREVVQFYAACPQTGLPKELRRLCGFAKTGLLAPGRTETVTVTFPVKALASFHESKAAWMTEAGLYGLYVGNSSRSLTLMGALEVERDSLVEQVDHICPLQEPLTEKVRPNDKAISFMESVAQELKDKSLPVLPLVVHPAAPRALPPSKALEAATALTDKLTDDQLIHMVVGEVSRGQGSALGSAGIAVPGAAGETSSILEEPYGIPGLPMADGPAGLRLTRCYDVSNDTGLAVPAGIFAALEGGFLARPEVHENTVPHYQFCTAFPVGTLLAQTWDPAMLEEVGRAVGREMAEYGITWWLAPGMNIHRDPLCGRNFEYYSEDPILSGIMAAAMTRGVQTVGGVGTTIKHFACNNQEDNRMGSDSILSERALREIYLRGFEIAVKESQPMAIMTSYNLINGIHAANSTDLCTKVAREEWGFAGIIMTDWTTTSPRGGSLAWMCSQAGNDLIMPGTEEDIADIAAALADGRLDRERLKACAARLIALAYQSNCYEDPVSYSEQFQN